VQTLALAWAPFWKTKDGKASPAWQ